LLELAFLCVSIYIIVIEYEQLDKSCDDKVFGPWILRAAVAELGIIHFVNIVRNALKLSMRVRKGKKQVKAGVIKCLLIDCYCCLASTGWAFAQVCFFLKRLQCSEKVPKTYYWLQIEVIYQYSQILYYLISNFMVIAIIIYLQQRDQRPLKSKA